MWSFLFSVSSVQIQSPTLNEMILVIKIVLKILFPEPGFSLFIYFLKGINKLRKSAQTPQQHPPPLVSS